LRPMEFMIDDIMKNISAVIDKWERMLITTITKRSSEELSDYLLDNWIKVKYLHSEIETLERIVILKELREWSIDVIVWVNLLREWLDLPEVSKIAILDADKQWFLRSESALIQIIWRAARNVNWTVYMYSEKVKMGTHPNPLPKREGTWINESWLFRLENWKMCNDEWLIVSDAMRKAIKLTNYRRKIQKEFNEINWIEPKTIYSEIKDLWINTKKVDYSLIDKKSIKKEIAKLELEMDIAAANTEYEKAAEIRDMLIAIKKGMRG
jgi:excinuclease ABC subunit B